MDASADRIVTVVVGARVVVLAVGVLFAWREELVGAHVHQRPGTGWVAGIRCAGIVNEAGVTGQVQ